MAEAEGAKQRREPPPDRSLFAAFVGVTTRWKDNDPYGHLNNVVY